jgi:paraquat-inducible protein B
MGPKVVARKHSHGANMPEDRVNIVDALRGQHEQLKRLIAQKMWISDAPKAMLSEIKAQLGELKRLIAQLESDVRDQLKKGAGTQPMKQRSPKAAAKARDLANQEIDKVSDQSASAEERQERKQRLLKGPGEFRDVRGVISPKPKS